MSEQQAAVDPLQLWRDWVSQSERQWNAYLNEVMGTEQFSQAMGRFMDVYLNMQKNMNDLMGRYFTAINIPTRTDILSLGDRLGAIEDRLVAIDSRLERLAPKQPVATAAAVAARPRPPRTKKPQKS